MSLPTLGLQLGGSLLSGLFGSRAARDQRRAAQQQQAMIAGAMSQARGDLSPYMNAGGNALGRMAAVDSGDFSAFESSPDYLFARDQSMRALDRSAAARGSLFSGGADADRMELASGLASQNLQNFLGRQMSLAGMGQNAATSLGSMGLQAAGAQANAIGAQGNANAARWGAWGGALNDMALAGGNYLGGRSGSWGASGRPNIPITPIQRTPMPIPRGF